MILSDEEILQVMTTDVVEGDYYLPHSFARAIEAAIIQKIGEPVAWIFDTDQEALLPKELELDTFKARPELYQPLYALPEVKK